MSVRRLFRRTAEGFRVRLSSAERAAIRGLPEHLRRLIAEESPSSDAAVARLFPPAYPDDPLRNLDFERMATDELTAGRLSALATLERTLDADRLTEDELLAWLGVLNDARLVLGTRLELTEGSTIADFPEDDPRAAAFAFYQLLSWMVEDAVQALGS